MNPVRGAPVAPREPSGETRGETRVHTDTSGEVEDDAAAQPDHQKNLILTTSTLRQIPSPGPYWVVFLVDSRTHLSFFFFSFLFILGNIVIIGLLQPQR